MTTPFRDILYLTPAKGSRVYVTIPTWLGPRIGTFTGNTHRAGTLNVLRYSISFPHSRTKTRTFEASLERHEFEVLSKGIDND